jgi:putative FmdB family regulatory protein
MPLYEYECTLCKRHTEKIQKFSDAEITACPYCGGLLERVVSAPAISFKGGGWFADGYGNAKPSGSGSGKSDTGSSSDVPSVAAAASASKDSSPSSASSAPAAPAAAPASSSSDKK